MSITRSVFFPEGNVTYHFGSGFQEVIYVETQNEMFKAVGPLGKGAHSTATLFSFKQTHHIVIKTPRDVSVTKHRFARQKKDIAFLKQIYPDAGPYFVHHTTADQVISTTSTSAAQPHAYQITHFSYVMMPYFQGSSLYNAVRPAKTAAEIAKIYLATAIELQRIHDLGILHGDIHGGNILIKIDGKTSEIKATFIDFEFAYRIDDKQAIKMNCCHMGNLHYPKERTLDIEDAVSPAFNQDIYSLGYMINCLWSDLPDLPHPDPAIAFCLKATSDTPSLRPDSLLEFITALKALIENREATPVSTTAKLIQQGIATSSRLRRCNAVMGLDALLAQASTPLDDKTPLMNEGEATFGTTRLSPTQQNKSGGKEEIAIFDEKNQHYDKDFISVGNLSVRSGINS